MNGWREGGEDGCGWIAERSREGGRGREADGGERTEQGWIATRTKERSEEVSKTARTQRRGYESEWTLFGGEGRFVGRSNTYG